MPPSRPLADICVVITRPVGTAAALARRVRARGGTPLLLPGSSLRAPDDSRAARTDLLAALACDAVIFTSPAAVRFARRLAPLRSRATVLAPGSGTRRALQRTGVQSIAIPVREDSEGMLALPGLRNVHARRIGIVGAAGGRELLERELVTRGAEVVHAHVYRRLPARLDPRHAGALRRVADKPLCTLLSSAEALTNIQASLPQDACRILLAGSAVVSSQRLASAARTAGFAHILQASSAHPEAMLDALVEAHHATR